MINNVSRIAAEILDAITKRYVIYDIPIPEKVLKLKDETMVIFEKAYNKLDEELPPKYEHQLLSIKKKLAKELKKGDRP